MGIGGEANSLVAKSIFLKICCAILHFWLFHKRMCLPLCKRKIFISLSSHRIWICKFDVNTCRSWERFCYMTVLHVFTCMWNIRVILVHLLIKGREQPIRVRIDEPTSVTKSQGQSVRFVCTASGSNTVSNVKWQIWFTYMTICYILFWAKKNPRCLHTPVKTLQAIMVNEIVTFTIFSVTSTIIF